MKILKRLFIVFLILAVFLGTGVLYVLHLPAVSEEGGERFIKNYTFLVYCTDRVSGNADAIVLAEVDYAGGFCSVMSIPRDTRVDDSIVVRADCNDGQGEVVYGWSLHKINTAVRMAGEAKTVAAAVAKAKEEYGAEIEIAVGDDVDLAGVTEADYFSSGTEVLTKAVTDLTGVPVDYTVGITLDSLADIIDACGGVDYQIPCDMDYDDTTQNLSIHYTATDEPVHLTGAQAVEIMRYRHNNDGTTGLQTGGDIDRLDTQRGILTALVQQTGPVKLLSAFRIFLNEADTNLTLRDLLSFGANALLSGVKDNITTATLPGTAVIGSNGGSYWCVNPEELLDYVNSSGLNPYVRKLTSADLDVYTIGEDRNFYPYNW